MPEIRISLQELRHLDESTPSTSDLPALESHVRAQFAFLPQPLELSVDGETLVIRYPDIPAAKLSEAERIAAKASKKAAAGEFHKAIDLFNRALEIDPGLHASRRDLAMTCMEIGQVDNAVDHLIEVLRMNPADAWALVVLGNIYLGQKRDFATGERFMRRALEIKPEDAWAVNGLAAALHKQDRFEEALPLFDRAISLNPDFPNAYLGKAHVLEALSRPVEALDALTALFSRSRAQDVRTQGLFGAARNVFARLTHAAAQLNESDAFKCVQQYKREVEDLSGYPVRVEEVSFKDSSGAQIKAAWKHSSPHHVLATRRGYDPLLLTHVESHELTHLRMESLARAVGRNKFFSTTKANRDLAYATVEMDYTKMVRDGMPPNMLPKLGEISIAGLSGLVFNAPLDILIEKELYDRFPVLRHAQYLSLCKLADEALRASTEEKIVRYTPRKLMRANLAINSAYMLALDRLYGGASDFAGPFRRLDNFDMGEKLFAHWMDRAAALEPGDEYDLVDETADMLGLSGWYTWIPDPGTHTVEPDLIAEGTTDNDLLREKHPAAVWYMLDALKLFDRMQVEEIKKIVGEITIVGQEGLDYTDPKKEYRLATLPDKVFSGLQLMCLMFVGFKRFAPELDSGMDLDEPFSAALEMFQSGGER
jgi:cytochrome c-type biogenesis protein CcmH/NrfG